jgi:hypothetical protein
MQPEGARKRESPVSQDRTQGRPISIGSNSEKHYHGKIKFANTVFRTFTPCSLAVDVLTQLTVKDTTFRDLKPCSLVKRSICQAVFHNHLKTFKVK